MKPGFYKHEALSALPADVHLLAGALLNYADDEGYFNANPKLVIAECCPLREPSMSIHGALSELSRIGYIELGSTPSDGRHWGRVVNFPKHQRVNRPTPSEIRCLPIVWDGSLSAHGIITERSLGEGKGREGKQERKQEGRESAPSALVVDESDLKSERLAKGRRLPSDWAPSEENVTHAHELGLTRADITKAAGTFRDYWLGVAGDKGIKRDWDATWRNWCRRTADELGRKPREGPNGAAPASGPQVPGNVLPGPRGIPQSDDEWLGLLVGWRDERKWPAWAGPHPQTAQSKCPRNLYAQVGLTAPGNVPGAGKGLTLDQQREMVEGIKSGALVLKGPAIGQPGCLISDAVAVEAGILDQRTAQGGQT